MTGIDERGNLYRFVSIFFSPCVRVKEEAEDSSQQFIGYFGRRVDQL